MHESLPLSFVLIGILFTVSKLMQVDPPARVLAGIHEFGTTAFACTPNGRRFISGGFRDGLRIRDAATLHPAAENHGHRQAVGGILLPASGDVVGGGDDVRRILLDGKRIKQPIQGTKVTARVMFHGQVVSDPARRIFARLVSGHVAACA
jgi:hypothetical protein